MIIKVKVTKEILKRTYMCSTKYNENCAVAEAVRELFPDALVGRHSIALATTPGYIALPLEATRFINAFDGWWHQPDVRLTLPEFSFEIDVPNEIINSIGIGQVYKILSESKTLEHVSI